MRTLILSLTLCALGVGCRGTAGGDRNTATARAQIEQAPTPLVIPVRPFQGKLRSVSVSIAGTERTFLFDTGGGVTVISSELARELDCRPKGEATGFRLAGDKLVLPLCGPIAISIGDRVRTYPTVVVMDLNKLMPPEWPTVSGMLSLQSFAGERLLVDLKNDQIVVTPTVQLAPMSHREIRQASGVSLGVVAKTNAMNHEFWFLVDSACFVDGFILSPHTAESLGFEVPELSSDPGKSAAHPLDAVDVNVDGLGAVSAPALVKDTIYDGVICASVLNERTFLLDLSKAALH